MTVLRIAFLSIVGSLVVSTAQAKKLLILTDQPGATKANEIRKLIQTTVPFKLLKSSEFSISVEYVDPKTKPVSCKPRKIKYTDDEIYSLQYWAKVKGIEISPEELKKYKEGYTIDRLVECDLVALAALGVQFQADSLMFVHNSPWEGGSGGDIPIILSGSRPGIGMHEWLHGFGLADEYAYKKEEAPFFCNRTDWGNVAIFNDAPPYSSNDDVRIRHRDQIPWLTYLSPKADLITSNNLGSPKFGNLGIYQSSTCKNVSPTLKSWKPSGHMTIMENPLSTYIPKPYWTNILTGLGVGSDRIAALLKVSVTPTWLKSGGQGPGNPPPQVE
ncbi:MAG TPA: hypothetical protein VM432_05600 [Bdellovibrionales bacterium]|nr:hypothetical protein [Bdellovibrionales bacterium]